MQLSIDKFEVGVVTKDRSLLNAEGKEIKLTKGLRVHILKCTLRSQVYYAIQNASLGLILLLPEIFLFNFNNFRKEL